MSWHLIDGFFSSLCFFAYGSLLPLQPKFNCDNECWLHRLPLPIFVRKAFIWFRERCGIEGNGEPHVNDLPPGQREAFARCQILRREILWPRGLTTNWPLIVFFTLCNSLFKARYCYFLHYAHLLIFELPLSSLPHLVFSPTYLVWQYYLLDIFFS